MSPLPFYSGIFEAQMLSEWHKGTSSNSQQSQHQNPDSLTPLTTDTCCHPLTHSYMHVCLTRWKQVNTQTLAVTQTLVYPGLHAHGAHGPSHSLVSAHSPSSTGKGEEKDTQHLNVPRVTITLAFHIPVAPFVPSKIPKCDSIQMPKP